jgi:hypothetical protein
LGSTPISVENAIKICTKFRVDIGWLLMGNENMNRGTTEQEPKMIIKWLVEWWDRANEEERNWMNVQMKRCLPEYGEWIER